MGDKPVLDYRSPAAPRVTRSRSPEDTLGTENLLIALFILTIFGAPILLCLWANYAMNH